MAARSYRPIGVGNDMALSRSDMSLEEIFGSDGNFEGVKALTEKSNFIPIEEIPDRALNPEQLAIRKGL